LYAKGLIMAIAIEYFEPNAETKAAIEEARTGKLQGPLDVSSVEAMYRSMD
jgi:hypothetical protein